MNVLSNNVSMITELHTMADAANLKNERIQYEIKLCFLCKINVFK